MSRPRLRGRREEVVDELVDDVIAVCARVSSSIVLNHDFRRSSLNVERGCRMVRHAVHTNRRTDFTPTS